MEKKKEVANITIECSKEELSSALNFLKDMIASVMKCKEKDVPNEPEPKAFQPQKGDICTYLVEDNIDTIFRYNGKTGTDADGTAWLVGEFILTWSGDLFKPYAIIYEVCRRYPADDCRLATEEEIKLFNEKTEDAKKDEYTEQTPNKNEVFWTIKFAFDAGGIFEAIYMPASMWYSPVFADARKIGWMFHTREECQSFCDKLNEAIKDVKP